MGVMTTEDACLRELEGSRWYLRFKAVIITQYLTMAHFDSHNKNTLMMNSYE